MLSDMLEHLFGSKTRLKLLRTLFRDPSKSYYVRELTRVLESQINAVRRELEVLVKAGIVEEIVPEEKANKFEAGATLRKYYRLNRSSILYSELDALLIKAQTLGEEHFIKQLKERAGDVKLLLLSGKFTNDKAAPTDMLLIGALHERTIAKMVDEYEKECGFPIRYTIMAEQEFQDRRHIMDKFLYSVFEANHVKVVNLLGVQ